MSHPYQPDILRLIGCLLLIAIRSISSTPQGTSRSVLTMITTGILLLRVRGPLIQWLHRPERIQVRPTAIQKKTTTIITIIQGLHQRPKV